MWREKVRESWERSSLFLIFLGKTCLLISYVTGQFPEESVSKQMHIALQNQQIILVKDSKFIMILFFRTA